MGSFGLARGGGWSGGAGPDGLGEGLLGVRTGGGDAVAEGHARCGGVGSFDSGTLELGAVDGGGGRGGARQSGAGLR